MWLPLAFMPMVLHFALDVQPKETLVQEWVLLDTFDLWGQKFSTDPSHVLTDTLIFYSHTRSPSVKVWGATCSSQIHAKCSNG